MKNRRIEVSIVKTINLGNYESLRIGANYSCDISDGDNLYDEYENAWIYVKEQIQLEIDRSIPKEEKPQGRSRSRRSNE